MLPRSHKLYGYGNGASDEAVSPWERKGQLPLPILCLSSYIIAHKADYYRLLLAVTREQAFGKEKLFVHPKLTTLITRDSNAFQPYR